MTMHIAEFTKTFESILPNNKNKDPTMTRDRAKTALIYRIIGLLISTTGIVLHMLADNIIETGFMVRYKLAYFTIQTNIWIALLFAILVIKTLMNHKKDGKWNVASIKPGLHGALTFYIFMTFLVFWGVLAPTSGVPANRFLFITSFIMHFITPMLAIADFLMFCPRGKLEKRHAAIWLSYPIGYLVFVMLFSRVITEPYYAINMKGDTINLMYPYPFLDPQVMGNVGVVIAVILLAAVFYALARLFVFIDDNIAKRKTDLKS